ncbi:hypothetical protein ACHAWF_011495 [Thalassiosira exigua]
MPIATEPSQISKRLRPDYGLEGDGGGKSSKRRRVRFNGDSGAPDWDKSKNTEEDEEDVDVEFVLSIAEDGDWDYTIISRLEEGHVSPAEPDEGGQLATVPSKNSLPASPPGRLGEEPWAEEPLLRVNSCGSLGNALTISLKACDDAAAMRTPTPLITPPSSPRRICTVSCDGVTTEEATICEWPCNLTVDNAITAALESSPLALPLGSSCAEE